MFTYNSQYKNYIDIELPRLRVIRNIYEIKVRLSTIQKRLT